MKKYRKKPVVVEALRLTPETLQEAVDLKAFGVMQSVYCFVRKDGSQGFSIRTLEGRMTAGLGDWIIRGVKGELYPCRHDIFEQTYEEVED
jgi:hypothetical protein